MEKFFKNAKNTVLLGVGLAAATPVFSEGVKIQNAKNSEKSKITIVHDKHDKGLRKYKDSLELATLSQNLFEKAKKVTDVNNNVAIGQFFTEYTKTRKKIEQLRGRLGDPSPILQKSKIIKVSGCPAYVIRPYPNPTQKVVYEPLQEPVVLEGVDRVQEIPEYEKQTDSVATKVNENELVKIYPIYQDPSDTSSRAAGHVVGHEKITYDKKTGKIISREVIK